MTVVNVDDPSAKDAAESANLLLVGGLEGLDRVPAMFAAFDTRADITRILSGAASGRIEHRLKERGSRAVLPAASFLVSKETVLEDGELDRARRWGASAGNAAGIRTVS